MVSSAKSFRSLFSFCCNLFCDLFVIYLLTLHGAFGRKYKTQNTGGNMGLANINLKRLRKVRESKGLSQGILSGISTVQTSTISNAERGMTVKHSTAERLAKALGVKVEDLR